MGKKIKVNKIDVNLSEITGEEIASLFIQLLFF